MTDTPDFTPIADWEDVTLTLLYADGNKAHTRVVNLVRSEVEAEQREDAIAQAHETYPEGEQLADMLREIESWTMTTEEFRTRILNNAQRMVTSPLQVPGKEPHQFKILPPWAVRGLLIEVNNLRSKIVPA